MALALELRVAGRGEVVAQGCMLCSCTLRCGVPMPIYVSGRRSRIPVNQLSLPQAVCSRCLPLFIKNSRAFPTDVVPNQTERQYQRYTRHRWTVARAITAASSRLSPTFHLPHLGHLVHSTPTADALKRPIKTGPERSVHVGSHEACSGELQNEGHHQAITNSLRERDPSPTDCGELQLCWRFDCTLLSIRRPESTPVVSRTG